MFFRFRTKRFVRKYFKHIPEETALKWVARLRALYIFSAWNLVLFAGYFIIKGGDKNSTALVKPTGNVISVKFKGIKDGYEIERISAEKSQNENSELMMDDNNGPQQST